MVSIDQTLNSNYVEVYQLAYTKQGFKDGDILKAQNLILMEDGIISSGHEAGNGITISNNVISIQDKMFKYLEGQLKVSPEIKEFKLFNGNIPVLGTLTTATNIDGFTHYESNNNCENGMIFKVGSEEKKSGIETTTSTSPIIKLPSAIVVQSDTDFTLSGVDYYNKPFSKTVSLKFGKYLYYRHQADDPGSYPASFIIGGTRSSTVVSVPYKYTIIQSLSSEGEYLFISTPTSFGTPKFYDSTETFEGGFDIVKSEVDVNGVKYDVYRSTYQLVGNTTIIVKGVQ